MNRRKPFTQADVSRAIKGAQSAGLKVQRFEIEPTGKIIVISDERPAPGTQSEFDAWKVKHARSA